MAKKYPQAPPFANDQEIQNFLAKPLLARLSSHNKDGTIHIAPVYYLYEKGEFLLGTQSASRKARNIQRDKHVSLLIDAYEPELQAVLVYGEATLDDEDLVTKRISILERYYASRSQAEAFVKKLTDA